MTTAPEPTPDERPDDRDAAQAELAERFADQDSTRAGAVDEVAATLDQPPTDVDPAVAALFRPPYPPGTIQLHVTVHIDETGLWAEVPELPGLFATGETAVELGASLGEAAHAYLIEHTEIVRGDDNEESDL